jgi:hypothetical protein
MKVIITIILALAAIASAAPSPNADEGPLSARQSCSYSVFCNEDDEGEEPDPDTARCCAASGGSGDAFVRLAFSITLWHIAVIAVCLPDCLPACLRAYNGERESMLSVSWC